MNIQPNPHLVLDALGHRTRRDILTILRRQPASVIAIANELPISRPAVSKHLRLLEKANLVKFEASGASHIFRLNRLGFQEAQRYLDAFWDDALQNFKTAVEKEENN